MNEPRNHAKELRAAALAVKKAVEQPGDDDIMDCSLCTDAESMALVNHILGTVYEDDEHHIDWQWLQAVTGYEREVSGSLVSVNVTEELSLVGDLEYPNVWQVWFNEYEIGECVDRAGFRSLCRGLGITLKETT